MAVRAEFRTLLVRRLSIIVIMVGVNMRVRMHSGLHDWAGIFVAVLESRHVRAAEHDPEDHKQGQHESPHRGVANTPVRKPQYRKILVCSK